VAVLVVGGYVLFTRAGRSEAPGGPFTPFQSATPFRPGPPGNVLAPRPPGAPRQLGGGAGASPFPYAPRPGNGPSMPLPIGREMAVVDLNAASLAELETLPDITPDYARKIVTGRPYQSMGDLERAGIPHKIVENISPPAIIRLTQRGSPPPDVGSRPSKTP